MLFAKSDSGDVFRFTVKRWIPSDEGEVADELFGPRLWYASLEHEVGSAESVRDVATDSGEVAVAAASGLFLGDGKRWQLRPAR